MCKKRGNMDKENQLQHANRHVIPVGTYLLHVPRRLNPSIIYGIIVQLMLNPLNSTFNSNAEVLNNITIIRINPVKINVNFVWSN